MLVVMNLLMRMATKPKCESNGWSHVVAVVEIGTIAHDDGMLVIILG